MDKAIYFSKQPRQQRTSWRNAGKRLLAYVLVGLAPLLLSACGPSDNTPQEPPAPVALSDDSVGHYCGMYLNEHVGPKGQILLRDYDDTVWFSTIREVFAYTFLPEEPKAILAIYVQDMGQAGDDGNPPDDAWIDAKSAHYLIESSAIGGMGAPDALPFAQLADAEDYRQLFGGRIVSFAEMPEDYVLRYNASEPTNITPAPGDQP